MIESFAKKCAYAISETVFLKNADVTYMPKIRHHQWQFHNGCNRRILYLLPFYIGYFV